MTDPTAPLDAVIGAQTFPMMLDALAEALETSPDHLFVVDHDVEQVRFLTSDRTVRLDGDLGSAFLRAQSVETTDAWWLPIVEGESVVFGVRYDDAPEADRPRLRRTADRLGACTTTIRSRFEDVDVRRRRRAMSVAAELQWGVLPTRADSVGGYRFASVLEPAYDVAGDLFDYAWSNGALWVYSLDAMGHGLEATTSGVVALTAIRNARRDGAGLVEQMSVANAAVQRQWNSDRFVTAVACRLDADGIEVVNAGHEPLRRRIGDSVTRLEIPTSIPLGVDAGTRYHPHALPPLAADESLILLSDGSTEARNDAGESFGDAAVDATLSHTWSASPQQAAHDYLERVKEYIGGRDVGDDITIVIVSTRKPEAS